ncbi:MAG: S8 family serine peptidase, partial [Thermoplasmatales archaeon]|nr:S8 family serine peptidase [Thermoplasmatales archaeon]
IEAMEWCIAHKDTHWENQPPEYWGIDVISCSGGIGDFEDDGQHPLSQEANKIVEAGIVFVVAAGNMGAGTFDVPSNIDSPATADKVICVGNVDDNDTVDRSDDVISSGSSAGPRLDDGDDDHYDELKPDVCAPGRDIMCAKFETEDEYKERGGTSVSCPHVAGVVALMLQANPALKPTPDRNPIQEILRKTAESRGTPDSNLGYEDSDSYYNYSYGWGIVDAYKAVRAAEEWEVPHQNVLPGISITNPKNNAEVSDTIMISGSASDSDGSVTNVEIRFDENNWFNVSIVPASSLNWNYTWDTTGVGNGKHTIYARCYDGMNYSATTSVDVNVYNKVSAGGAEEKTKINPVYLISGAGIIGAVVIIVVCVLLFRRKRLTGLPVSVPPHAPPPVSQPVPFVTAKCPKCGNIMKITSAKRPVKVKCPKCGAGSILR